MAASDDARKIAGWLKANPNLKGTPQYEKAATALRNAHLAAMQAGNGTQAAPQQGGMTLDMAQNARLATPAEVVRGGRINDNYRDGQANAQTRAIAELDRATPESIGARAGGAGMAALQGLGFNFADEIGGGLAAAGTYLTTGDATQSGEAYADTRDTLRRTEEAYTNRHPTEAFVANMAGGLVTGLATAPRSVITGAGSLGARTARAGLTGLGYGGLAGLGAGEDGMGNRLASGAIGAGGGAVLGGLTETIGSALLRTVGAMGGSGPLVDPATGQITRAGLTALQRVGLTPADVPTPTMLRLEEIRRRAPMAFNANTDAAVNIARGESLPVPVNMTRGQATQDPAILSNEYRMARAGADGPGRIIREARGAQEDALRDNVPAIQAQLASGGPIITRGEGGASASNRLNTMREAATRRADALYDNARTAGSGVFMDGRAGVGTAQRIATRLTADHAVENIPRVQREVDRIASAGDNGDVPVRTLFETRQRLNSIRASGGEEAVAARKAIGELDASLDDALRLSLLRGDQTGIAAWRDAISNYREYADQWKRRDVVGELTRRDPRKGFELAHPPEEAANFILGASDLGLITKRDMHRDLSRLRDALGDTSQEWNGIRQEAFLRIVQRAEGAQSSDGRTFSGAKLATAWEDFNRKAPDVARVLFTDQERRDIGNFVNVARRVTTLNRDAANPSGTGYAVERLMRAVNATGGLLQKVPALGRGLAWAAEKWKEGGDLIKANSYVRQPLPGAVVGAGILNPASLSAGSAALATWQNERQSRQRP